MQRLFKSKIFVVVLITIIILVIMGISARRDSKINWVNNVVSVPLTPIQKFFSFAGQKVEAGFTFFKDIKTLKQENETLKNKVSELERQNRELNGYKEKISELRQALNLKERFADYQLIGGNVIAKDPGNWFDVFKIDIGQRDGVIFQGDIEYPVVTGGMGLVGRVFISDITSSKVVAIIDEDSVVFGWISKQGGGHVRIKGDITLKEKGLCLMDYISPDVDVAVGDIIETSGLGGVYPKGILIGKVVEVKKTTSELDRYAIIEPAVDFKKLEEVFVLKSKNKIYGNGSAEK